MNIVYPTGVELKEIEQELLPNLLANDPIFGVLPIETSDEPYLTWEQEDDWVGLQQLRGLNGAPPRVAHTGGKSFIEIPGVYGEHEVIDEIEITTRRPWGQMQGHIDLTAAVRKLQDKLLKRRLDRIAMIGWKLLTTGTFSVSTALGSVAHAATYTTQTYNASTWATYASAVPLLDLKAVSLLGRGKGVDFGSRAQAFCNQKTWNDLTLNNNSADLGRRFATASSTLGASNDVLTMFKSEGLPQFTIVEGGYKNDAGTWVLHVPDGVVVVVGYRTDAIGGYRMTRNAQNPDAAPGAYTKVFDRREETVPGNIEVHDGHNGGPVLYHPASVVIMDVS